MSGETIDCQFFSNVKFFLICKKKTGSGQTKTKNFFRRRQKRYSLRQKIVPCLNAKCGKHSKLCKDLAKQDKTECRECKNTYKVHKISNYMFFEFSYIRYYLWFEMTRRARG